MPPGGAGTSRHCSLSSQSGSASQLTAHAIQPPAAIAAASPRVTITKPALVSALPWDRSPTTQAAPPPTTSVAPSAASERGPRYRPTQPEPDSRQVSRQKQVIVITVRRIYSAILSTVPPARLC